MVFRVTIVMAACALAIVTAKLHPLSDEFIDLINSKQNSWKAGRNFPPNMPMNQLENLLGVDSDFNVDSLPRVEHAGLEDDMPESFDAREKWPNCPSIGEIRDQGSCSSSWAFAAVEAMTDRVCIYSNGSRQFHFSAKDLVSCCANNGGCHGGKPERAWNHWKSNGIVSGGNYNSSQGCKPYSFPSCEHRAPGNTGSYSGEKTPCVDHKNVETPKCVRKCDNKKLSYEKDKIYGKHVYNVELNIHIMAELYKNGPVEAVFWLYADFFNYKSGVYMYSGGDFIGLHAVKIIGWGVENGQKYWLAVNSWNANWGDHGFFKIVRGEGYLQIESYIIAGEPLLTAE